MINHKLIWQLTIQKDIIYQWCGLLYVLLDQWIPLIIFFSALMGSNFQN